jgi:hypothetical protein
VQRAKDYKDPPTPPLAGTEVEFLGVLRIGDIGDRDGLLVDIQTDVECARVFHG